MPAPDCTFNMTMICAGVLLIPSLLDFAYLTIDTEGWDSAAVVAPAWYPISGVILAVLFLYGGYKGKKEASRSPEAPSASSSSAWSSALATFASSRITA